MKNIKYFIGLCLVALLSINVFASGDGSGNNHSGSSLNHKMFKLLDANEFEYPIGGVAIVQYTINEEGVIKILNLEASDENLTKYVYRHLEGKKIKLTEGINVGEHSLKILFQSLH